MKQEISPKTAAIVLGILAVVVLAIGYKVFFARPAEPAGGAALKPGNERFRHPTFGTTRLARPAQPSSGQ
ncbi:MAG TPA: hypothetical protein VFB21_22500 [Chthonomonadaceae bacterium]|nr:hypothetical protein [Chthonomonadaceae bacterium]